LWVQAGACHNQAVLTIGVVALGVDDVARAARFWCEALDYKIRDDGFGGWSTVLTPSAGMGTMIALQRSQTPPQDHPRLHLDLHTADANEQEAEVKRLVSLGAERVDWDSYPDDPDFVVLADPDGNRFCVVDLSHEQG
jgi:catechol 2,3-dioxygenase-like lactoylglutathione lyase family enzyme